MAISKLIISSAIAFGSGVALAGDQGVVTFNAQDDNAKSHLGRPPSDNPVDWDNIPVSPQTVEMNQLLFEIRDQVAAMAEWDGPGPNDINPLIMPDGFDGPRQPPHTPRDLSDLDDMRRALSRISATTRHGGKSSPSTVTVLEPIPAGIDGDNRSLARFNLWPGGEIPYTFSDFMINSFFFAPDPNPEEINAAAGVANALAVMIIMEQETPLRFVGYDPTRHAPGSILIWDNVGDGENPPPAEDVDDDDTDNFVTRIGRSSLLNSIDIPPTTIAHGYWQNFPSMIRSIGFVVGLDWEQRHPDRNTFIQIHPENIPPAFGPDGLGWPRPVGGDGNLTPGFPLIQEENDAGQQLFAIATNDPTVFPAGSFDLDSMMLIDELGYNNALPMYTIHDTFRYVDLNGDGTVDTTPFGPDDLMGRGEPVFFSEGDITAINELYALNTEPCPADVNDDGVVSDLDVQVYIEWYNEGNVEAELTGDTCVDQNNDGISENDCIDVADLVQFFVLMQQSTECGTTVDIGGGNTIQPI